MSERKQQPDWRNRVVESASLRRGGRVVRTRPMNQADMTEADIIIVKFLDRVAASIKASRAA